AKPPIRDSVCGMLPCGKCLESCLPSANRVVKPVWSGLCEALPRTAKDRGCNREDLSMTEATVDAGSISGGKTTTDAGVGQRLKSIFGGAVGNLVEWYDWYAYSAFALYFAKAFFPAGDTTAQLLNTAAVFALGFIMLPIGGWLMGVYADRFGRRAALSLSVLLMCAGSLVIALTPGYATIGLWAPALLVFARLVQGISLGGEYGASATYLSEVATPGRRGFYSSFQYVTLIMGQLTALAVLLILQFVV